MRGKKINKVFLFLVCIFLNFLGYSTVRFFRLPIWLDTLGTGIAACFLGFPTAVFTGIFSYGMIGMFQKCTLYHIPAMLLFTLIVYYTWIKGRFDTFYKIAVTGFWAGVLDSLLSAIIDGVFAGGYCGNSYGEILTDMMKWYNIPAPLAIIGGEAIVEILDKQIVMMLLYLLVKRFGDGKKLPVENMKKLASLILPICIVFSTMSMPLGVFALDNRNSTEGYVPQIYDSSNYLVTSSANTIVETSDGHIWIGGYAGLTKFDGNEFTFLRQNGLTSITCMLADTNDNLWVGTNDGGLIRFDHGELKYWTKQDGLPVNTIRSIVEAEDGRVFIGTNQQLCVIEKDDSVRILSDEPIFAKKMCVYEGILVVIDFEGHLFTYQNDKLESFEPVANATYGDLETTEDGVLLAETSGKVDVLNMKNGEFVYRRTAFDVQEEITLIHKDRTGRYWIGMNSGIAYREPNGRLVRLKIDGFDSSYEDIHEDYQGNIWIASSRYGVLKLSESQFINLFDKYHLSSAVVNTVIHVDDELYCGTDSGLFIINEKKASVVKNDLTEMLSGIRIRFLMSDSKERLWISTYSDMGLIYVDRNGKIKTYNVEKDGLTSNRVRCTLEAKDGTIVVGTTDGINFIKDGKVTGKLTAEDGLLNTQILTLVQDENGKIYAGSDGAGIFVIEGQKVVKTITANDGITSDVILRMVKIKEGMFIICSNALCFMDTNGNIKVLDNFPYYNNYDILQKGDVLYITGSAGIYEVNKQELLSNSEDMNCRLYHANEGLLVGMISNSFNQIVPGGTLYLCSNQGVICFSPSKEMENNDLKFDLESVEIDGVYREYDGKSDIVLPAESKMVVLRAGIRNYSLRGAKVRFFMEDNEEQAKVYEWNQVETIQIPQIGTGKNVIHLQMMDSYGKEVVSEKIYTVSRRKQPWEELSYIIYLWMVAVEICLVAVWSLSIYYMSEKKKEDLEKLHVELEEKIKEQTEEILEEQKKQERLLLQTVVALSGAVDAKDKYTSGHSKRVAEYSQMIAKRMGKSVEEQEYIFRAGLLHDVGKIGIPEDIINKTGKLTDEEYDLIKVHPVTGYGILKKIDGNNGIIAMGAKFHHERYDGKGYPNGLAGENIPEIGRIIGVADSYDAMASNRSYRRALSQEVVKEEIIKGRGTQFDPKIADIMLELMEEDKDYHMRQQDVMDCVILAVDDSAMNIRIISTVLKDEPRYKVVGVDCGDKALDYLREHKVDLILLDLMLPDMDGFEVLSQLKDLSDSPVVFMTGDKNLETIEKASEWGVEDYITKPFRAMELKEIIHSVLRK